MSASCARPVGGSRACGRKRVEVIADDEDEMYVSRVVIICGGAERW